MTSHGHLTGAYGTSETIHAKPFAASFKGVVSLVVGSKRPSGDRAAYPGIVPRPADDENSLQGGQTTHYRRPDPLKAHPGLHRDERQRRIIEAEIQTSSSSGFPSSASLGISRQRSGKNSTSHASRKLNNSSSNKPFGNPVYRPGSNEKTAQNAFNRPKFLSPGSSGSGDSSICASGSSCESLSISTTTASLSSSSRSAKSVRRAAGAGAGPVTIASPVTLKQGSIPAHHLPVENIAQKQKKGASSRLKRALTSRPAPVPVTKDRISRPVSNAPRPSDDPISPTGKLERAASPWISSDDSFEVSSHVVKKSDVVPAEISHVVSLDYDFPTPTKPRMPTNYPSRLESNNEVGVDATPASTRTDRENAYTESSASESGQRPIPLTTPRKNPKNIARNPLPRDYLGAEGEWTKRSDPISIDISAPLHPFGMAQIRADPHPSPSMTSSSSSADEFDSQPATPESLRSLSRFVPPATECTRVRRKPVPTALLEEVENLHFETPKPKDSFI